MSQGHLLNGANDCPSSWALQRFALCPRESDEVTAKHVATCARCQEFVAQLQAEGASYMSSPAADALQQRLVGLEAEGRPPSVGRGPRVWAWGGALAAAACLALFFSTSTTERTVGHPQVSILHGPLHEQWDPLTPKGTAQLALWVGDQGEAQVELAESAVLHSGERVQPVFSAPKDGFVALLLTLPSGERIQLYPAELQQSAPVQASPRAPLGPSFRLDDEVGSYRVAAYFAESTFSTQVLLATDSAHEEPTFQGLVLVRRFEVKP